MYKIFIVLIAICLFSSTSEHPTTKAPLKSIGDVENWIRNHYHPDSAKLHQVCQSSCVFIRFKILKSGKVSNLAFNKHIPAFITDALSKSLESLEKNTIISSEMASDEKTYLLPFIYDYQAGAKIPMTKNNSR